MSVRISRKMAATHNVAVNHVSLRPTTKAVIGPRHRLCRSPHPRFAVIFLAIAKTI